MSSLANQQINSSFSGLLQIPGGITSTLQTVQDGNGNPTGLSLSSTGAGSITVSQFAPSVNGVRITGSINRLINDGFGDFVSVKDFGAVGDGITDDTAAIQSAINHIGNSTYRGTVYIPSGAYKITSSLRLTPVGNANGLPFNPMVIRGDGWNTQLNNVAPSNNPTFNLSGSTGVEINDLLFTGNTPYPNNGILINGTSNNVYFWAIKNCVFQMAGDGIKLTNTNTGLIRDCKFWPDTSVNGGNAPWIPQNITFSSVGHGIHITGDYTHNIMIDNCSALSYSGFAVGSCGIRSETTYQCNGINVIGGLYQSLDATTSTVNCAISADHWVSAVVEGLYIENATLKFTDLSTSRISNCSNGGVGGSLILGVNCQWNFIQGIYCLSGSMDGSIGSTVVGSVFGSFSDTNIPQYSNPNRYINCTLGTGNYVRDRALLWKKGETGTGTVTPNPLSNQYLLIRVSSGSGFTIASPSSKYDASPLIVTIQNESGGAMGTITWSSIFKMSAWTNPANGYNRTISFIYDLDFNCWRQTSQTGVDIPN